MTSDKWEMKQLEYQIQEIDAVVVRTSGQSEACQRLEAIPGIGPLTATAIRAGQLGGVREKQMLESALTASQVVNLRP